MVEMKLERVISERIEPLVDTTINRVLGISLPSLKTDISDRLRQNPRFVVNTATPFKEAKRQFKKYFLQKLLSTGVKRESLHRLIKQLGVEKDTDFRHYMKREAVKTILHDCVETYTHALHPARMKDMYQKIPALTSEIVEQLPDKLQSMDEAEAEFERAFIRQALLENNHNISATSRKIGLRFETLHRKMKKLEI
jgi:hypothetical protein